MPKINFKHVSFRNFMSYGNKTQTIEFDDKSCLITGKNGYGKSTIFMALFYALYGKTYKKVKLGSLINNVNNKDMYTEVSFEISDNIYLIKRGQKPSIFEIYENGTLIDQSASTMDYQEYLETYILKIPEHVFKQLIFFGANVAGNKTFMELTKSEKEEMFSIITDTSVFGLIRENINSKIKESKTSLTELNYKMDILKQSIISEQENIRKMEAHNEEAKVLNESRRASSEEDMNLVLEEIQKVSSKLDDIKALKPKYDKLSTLLSEEENKLSAVQKDTRDAQLILNKIEMTKKSFGNCIGCDKLKFLSDIDLTEEEKLISDISSYQTQSEELQLKVNEYKSKQKIVYDKLLEGKGAKEALSSLEARRDKLKESMELPSIPLMDIDYDSIETKKSNYKKASTKKEKATIRLEDLSKLLKLMDNNNLKGVILNQQLPVLNKYINQYMGEFSSEFRFNFYIDQNFKEKVTSKNKEVELQSLSNGYNMRLTFSIMFAFLKLVQERSGIDTNILVLDEALDSALDKEGREELLSIIRADFKSKTIFVISHNDEIKNNVQDFDRVMMIENNGFSTIKEIV